MTYCQHRQYSFDPLTVLIDRLFQNGDGEHPLLHDSNMENILKIIAGILRVILIYAYIAADMFQNQRKAVQKFGGFLVRGKQR